MEMKKSDQVIEYVKSQGGVEIPSTSRKYRKFTRPGELRFYWVGKSGALRIGPTIASSYSVTSWAHKTIKKEDDK